MPVYPGHREFAFYPEFYEKVLYNAQNSELINGNEGIKGFLGGAAVPCALDGPEAVWFTRTTGANETIEGEYSDIAVFPNGTQSTRRSRFLQESPYASRKNPINAEFEYPKLGDFAGYIMTYVTEPAATRASLPPSLSRTTTPKTTARYGATCLGSRRVRRAPTVGFDTPDGPGGLKTVDEVRGFNGSMERFDWKLLGRQEIFVPYHNYQFDDPEIDYDELLTKFHANPEHMRYELKRVWVAEARCATESGIFTVSGASMSMKIPALRHHRKL